MTKRILTAIVTAGIVLYALCVGVSASEAQKLIVANVKATQGETVSVDVFLKGNPGIWGIDAEVSYDKQYLELVSVSNGNIFDDGGYLEGNLTADKYRLSFECNDLTNVTGSGTLATLNFKVKSNTPSGVYPVTVSYSDGDIINVDEELVDFEIFNGSVTVASDGDPKNDVDKDKNVTMKDIVVIVESVAGIDNSEDKDLLQADSDKNSVITMRDLNRLITFIRRIVEKLLYY